MVKSQYITTLLRNKLTYGHWIDSWDSPTGNGGYHTFRSWKIYKAYREYGREYMDHFDFNMSFTGQFLKAGFETYGYYMSAIRTEDGLYNNIKNSVWAKKNITPTLNWHGTSVYAPDTLFIKGNKSMLMSIQGCSVPYNKDYDELFRNRAVKYIVLYDGDDKIYEDWTGNLPPKELVSKFIA